MGNRILRNVKRNRKEITRKRLAILNSKHKYKIKVSLCNSIALIFFLFSLQLFTISPLHNKTVRGLYRSN